MSTGVDSDFRFFPKDARDAGSTDAGGSDKWHLGSRLKPLAPMVVIFHLYGLTLYAFHRQGFLDGYRFWGIAAALIGCIGIFHVVFRIGMHERTRDRSLILPQIIAALLVLLAASTLERATQLALVPFILITLSFGLFRLSTTTLIGLAAACLTNYLVIIAVQGRTDGYGSAFRTDLLHWWVLAGTLPVMILAAREIEKLRQTLRLTRQQLQHFEEKSIRDGLTRLYNRSHMQEELENAKRLADTRGTLFSICLIDLDGFKQINDRHGHLAGDAVLRSFADTARQMIRDSDVIGRYGGDEFIQILPNTDLRGAIMHAERLRVRTYFLRVGELPLQQRVSLSIGVAQYRSGDRINDLISRADSALYQAKQLGRNRVEWPAD